MKSGKRDNMRQTKINILNKFIKAMVTVTLLGFSAGCVPIGEGSLEHPFGTRSFWALKIRGDVETPVAVPAVFIGSGPNVVAYKAVDSGIPDSQVQRAIDAFDSQISPIEHSRYGSPSDVDLDGKVTLFFLDIDDGYTPGNAYIAGYFNPIDLYSDKSAYSQLKRHSNEREILYIDTYPADVQSSDLLGTVAHEYQHLLHYNHMLIHNYSEETWLNEGLSELASDITGYGPQTSRLNYFWNTNDDSLIGWDGQLRDYAHVYTYFRYLADIFGEEILTRIFRSPKPGIESINLVIQEMADGNYLTKCGDHQQAGYEYFDCSYRFFLASLLNADSGKSGVNTNTFTIAPYTMTHKPADIPTAYSSGAQILYPYSYRVLTGSNPGITGSTSFTILYKSGASQYIVYNHSAVSLASGTVTASSIRAPAMEMVTVTPDSPQKIHYDVRMDPSAVEKLERIRP